MLSLLASSPIRVLLVDDHRMVLEGLRVLLQPLAYVEVVGSASTAAEALVVARATRPHIVLLDINLPDGNGIDVCRQLLAEQPGLRVVALTTFKERSYLTRMLQAGAAGYVLKNALPEELASALRRVQAGKKFFSDEIQDLLVQAHTVPDTLLLTRREKEILTLIADGFTSQSIAERLCISPLTIETHRRNLLVKFEATNTATLIKLAARQGLV
ncbi:MAG: response regulator [Janthinobacterium lividum]